MDLWRKKTITTAPEDTTSLRRCLSSLDLIFMGIGAIIGAGIFVLTGVVAATDAGPAIIFSYIFAGIACAFAALSYAELASTIGGCGGAYNYAYAGFGELIAWVVGWDLLLEYLIGVSTVSIGWSAYFNDLLHSLGIHINDYWIKEVNLLAVSIIAFLSLLLCIGVKTSTRANNFMVIIKLSVILLFILVSIPHVQPQNWHPFMPFGFSGVIQGASLIFFAYIGFDAVSTAAEECINPQRDLPRGIIGSLIICTLLYILVSVLLTGIISFKDLNWPSPISHAMLTLGHRFVAGCIGVGAIAGLTTVMLVLFYGLTRVFLALSRDGLFPPFFAKTNERTKTPIRIIIPSALLMSLLAAFLSFHHLAELVNIGTLFAFITVCIGVIVLRYTHPEAHRPFKTPLSPLIPALGALSCGYLLINLPWLTILRFIIWMIIGLAIYFLYSRYESNLAEKQS